MPKPTFRLLAKKISLLEGGAAEVNIAQISDVLRATIDLLLNYESWEVLEFLGHERDARVAARPMVRDARLSRPKAKGRKP